MGKDDRRAVSRIKLENLPKTCQLEAKKVGPLGLLRVASGPSEGLLLYVGPFGPFEVGFDITRSVVLSGGWS